MSQNFKDAVSPLLGMGAWPYKRPSTTRFTVPNLVITNQMKKRSERRKHCTLSVVGLRCRQKFSPRRRPASRGAGRPKFKQLETVTTFTYRPSLVKIDHAISSYRGNRPPNKHTHTHTHTHTQTRAARPSPQTGPITIHCAVKLSAQCNGMSVRRSVGKVPFKVTEGR